MNNIILNSINKFFNTETIMFKEISIKEFENSPSILQLQKKFGDSTRKTSYFKYKEPPFNSWISKFKKNGTKIIASYNSNEIIGFIIGQLKEDVIPFGQISAMYVKEDYRGKGISDKLFKQMISWLEEYVSIIRIRTMGSNYRAQKFYRKMGFVNEVVTMRNIKSKND